MTETARGAMTTKRPRRLLVVTTVPSTLHFLIPYVRRLREAGWEVDTATGFEGFPEDWEGWFDAVHRVRWSRRLADWRNVTLALARVRSLVANGRYDIVHTHTPIASLVIRAAIATLRKDRPAVVYTAHGFHFQLGEGGPANAAFAAAEWLAGRWTDRLVVINEEDRRAAVRLRIVPESSLRMFPGIGVDLEYYRPTEELHEAAAAFRGRLGIADDAPLFSVVAEMIPRKNHEAALAALARNPEKGYHLCLAGEGPLREELERSAHSLGIGNHVHFIGWATDVRPLLLASAALVLPSRREGLSRAVLESLAMGVPVIGGRTRGIADVVDKDAGILVDPGDVDALAVAFDRIRNYPTAGSLRPLVERRLAAYRFDTLVTLHEQLYDELLGERRPRVSV